MALAEYETLFRYLHILAGIVWIGLLYFFNLVNLPLLKFKLSKPYEVDMAEKVTPAIAVKTLFWFRWGALFTLITGLILLDLRARRFGGWDVAFQGTDGMALIIAVVLALVMFVNVWFIIWPNQQKVLTNNKKIAAGVDDEEKARLQAQNGPTLAMAVKASRFNTWASVPMLFGMVFGAHGAANWTIPVVVLGVILLLMVLYSNKKA